MTADKALDAFATYLAAAGQSEGTIRQRIGILRQVAALEGGLLGATEDVLLAFIASGDRTIETRRTRLAACRKFYRWAFRRGLVPSNPAEELPPIRRQVGLPRPCPDEVIAAALEQATPRARLAIKLAAFAGLRRSEIASLSVEDFTPEGIRVYGKGGKYRLVPVAAPIAEEIAGLPPGPIFPALRRGQGNPTTSDGVSFMVEQYLPRPWTLHTLRHRFATVTYRRTHDLRSVQQLMGHASIETTQVYTQVGSDDLRRAVEAATALEVARSA